MLRMQTGCWDEDSSLPGTQVNLHKEGILCWPRKDLLLCPSSLLPYSVSSVLRYVFCSNLGPSCRLGSAPAACLLSSRRVEYVAKPGTPGAPAAAAGQGQRNTFNLMLELWADNSSQPHAIAGNMLRHVGILPVQSKVRVDFPRGPVVKTPHFFKDHGF